MDDRTKFAVYLARESGKIQREYYRKRFSIRFKGDINLVTDVDIACQERIVSLIEKEFPGDEVIAEEKDNTFDGTKNRWIIDPLDGTTNYAHGYPFFCTSVAYEVAGDIVAGAVYNPVFDELFYGTKGEGAFFHNEKLSVSGIDRLKASLLSTGFPYDLPTNPSNNIGHFINFLHHAQAVRRDGSAALNLCYVACGRFEGHWELRLNPWDMAAGDLIVREAGGVVTNIAGGPFSIYASDAGIVATNGLVHRQMIDVLREGS